MANDYTALFNAIDIQLGASLRKAGFTRTLVGRVIGTVDATYGEYLVSYQTSQFSATSRNNIAYRVGDLVYVAYTNGDSNLGFQIIGKVSTNVQEKVDLLNSALERYTSLGDFSLEPEDATSLIFEPTENQTIKEKIFKQKEDGTYPLDLLDPNSETFDSFRRNLIISPKILCNLYVQPQTLNQEYIIDYGVEFTLEFNAGNQVEDALDQVDANGHDFSKYQRTYTFNIDKMVGQPLSYVTDGFMHQYAIFNIEKPENLVRVVSIKYYAIFNSGSYIETPRVSFGNCTICAAIDKNIDINSYYSVALNSTDNVSVIRNDQTLQLSAQFRFKDEECNPSNLEYYWFIEDLTVRAKDKKKYNSYGGEGWRCLNKKENIEKDNNNNLFTVEDWVPGSSTLVVDRNLANLYENRFKCCVYYNNGIIVSPVFTVINLNEQNKLRVKLTSKVRSYKWKNEGEQDADPALYDDSNLNRYVNSLDIGLTDTAVIIADLVNTPDTFNSSEVQYVWQKIDSLDQSSWFDPKTQNNNKLAYIYGSEIISNMTVKCGLFVDGEYMGAASVTLESIDDDLRARIASRDNLFNTITNNGKYQGIYYIKPTKDEKGNITDYEQVAAEDINNQNPEEIDLLINASRLQVLDSIGKTVFLADKYKKDVQIAGFIANERAIYNDKPEVDSNVSGAYFGIDGLCIGDDKSSIQAKKVNGAWELNVTGNIHAISLDLGDLKIPSDNLEVDLSDIDKSLQNLQNQIDGAIDTYSEKYIPTLGNEPAASWVKDKTEEKHLGDIFICQDETYAKKDANGKYISCGKDDEDAINVSGWTFRFNKDENGNYNWILLTDSNMPYIYDTLAKQSGDIISIQKSEYYYDTTEETINGNLVNIVRVYYKKDCDIKDDGSIIPPDDKSKVISTTIKDSSGALLTDVGVGTYKDPTSEELTDKDIYFKVDPNGLLTANNAVIYGTIYATAGKIGGFSLDTNILSLAGAKEIEKSYFGIDTNPKTGTGENDPGIWLGGTGGFENAVFSVDKAGKLKATSADITGVIRASQLYIGESSQTTFSPDNYVSNEKYNKDKTDFFVSQDTIEAYAKKVDSSGTVESGFGYSLQNNGFKIYNMAEGKEHTVLNVDANGLTVEGIITATGGSIGNWHIDGSVLWGESEDGTYYARLDADYTLANGVLKYPYAIWVGQKKNLVDPIAGPTLDDCGSFSVTKEGIMYANDVAAYIDGYIAGAIVEKTETGMRLTVNNKIVPNFGVPFRGGTTGYPGLHLSQSGLALAAGYDYSFSTYYTYGFDGPNGNVYTSAYYIGSGIPSTSDKKLKNSIQLLQENDKKIQLFYQNLRPVSFRYNNSNNKTHFGFIANEIEEKNNIADIFIPYEYFGNEKTLSLRYDEFIALNTYEIQKTKKHIKEMEQIINDYLNKKEINYG